MGPIAQVTPSLILRISLFLSVKFLSLPIISFIPHYLVIIIQMVIASLRAYLRAVRAAISILAVILLGMVMVMWVGWYISIIQWMNIGWVLVWD